MYICLCAYVYWLLQEEGLQWSKDFEKEQEQEKEQNKNKKKTKREKEKGKRTGTGLDRTINNGHDEH